MDEDTRKRLEYEEQLYGMSSQFFSDEYKNFLTHELSSTINSLIISFKSKIIHQAEDVEKFDLALNKMKTVLTEKYIKSVNDIFQEEGETISDILRIPSFVLLKEDLPIRNGVNKSIDDLKEEVEDLKKKFQSLIYLKQAFIEELEDADSTIILMENFVNKEKPSFDFLPAKNMCELSKKNIDAFDVS